MKVTSLNSNPNSNRRLITGLIRGGIVAAAVVALSSCAGGSDSSDAPTDSASDTTIAASKGSAPGSVGVSTSIAIPDSIAPSGPDQALMAQLSDALVGGTTIPEIEVSDGLTLTDVSVSRDSDGTIAAAGTANIGSAGLQLTMSASFTDENNWSLETSGAGLPTWEPEQISGLSVDPNSIAGSISSSDGVVTWDLNGSTLTWTPDGVMALRAQFGIGTTCPFEDSSKCPEGETFLKLIDAQMVMPGVTLEDGSPLTVAAVGGIATSGDWARLEASTADLTFEGNGVTDPKMTIWYGERNDSFDPNLEMPDLSSLSEGLNVEFCGGFSISIPKVANKSTSGCVNWSPAGFAMGQLGGGSSMSGTMPNTDFGSGNANGSANIMGVGFTNLASSALTKLPSPEFVFDSVATALKSKTFVLGGVGSLPGTVGKAIGVNTDGLTSLEFDITGSFSSTSLSAKGAVDVNIAFGAEPLKMTLTELSASIDLSSQGFAFTLGTTADATFGYSSSGGTTVAKMNIALTAVADPIPGMALVASAQGTSSSLTSDGQPTNPAEARYLWTNAFGINGYNLWNLSAQIGFISGSPALGYASTGYINPLDSSMRKIVDCGGSCNTNDYLRSNLILNVSLTEPCLAWGFDGSATNTAISLSGGVAKTTVFKIGVAPNGCTVGSGDTAVTLPKLFFGFQFVTDIKGTEVEVITTTSEDGLYAKYEVSNFRLGPVNYKNVLFEFEIETNGSSSTTFAADMETSAGVFQVESSLVVNTPVIGPKTFNQHLYAYINASSGNWNWNGKSTTANSSQGIRAGDPAFEVKELIIDQSIVGADKNIAVSLNFSGSIEFRGRSAETVGSLKIDNNALKEVHFEFDYTKKGYGGKTVTATFYLDWSSSDGIFDGRVDTRYTRDLSYKYGTYTYKRGVSVKTYIQLTINTRSGAATFKLGGDFDATNISGGIDCAFSTTSAADTSCKGTVTFYKKDLFKKTFDWSGL